MQVTVVAFVHHTASKVVHSMEGGERAPCWSALLNRQQSTHTGKDEDEEKEEDKDEEEVLTSAWVEAWSIAATDKDVLGSMSSNASSMFS